MDEQMLEQIQQMIVTATESLRQEMAATKNELREDIADGKRYAGILAEDLHHKLELVIEGRQFLGQRIDNVHADLDAKHRETKTLLELPYRHLNGRVERLEQRRDT
jgi:hypothetical protein